DYPRVIDGLGQTVASFDGARLHERFGQANLPAERSRSLLAWCHAELGTFTVGRALGEQGIRLAGPINHAVHRVTGCWRSGLLSLTRRHQERGHQAYTLRLLGHIAAQREPSAIEPAEAHYQQALALADALGMRPLMAHCHLGLGTLYAKSGRPEQARPELSA